jgi:hypothetical protein
MDIPNIQIIVSTIDQLHTWIMSEISRYSKFPKETALQSLLKEATVLCASCSQKIYSSTKNIT